MKQPPDHFWDFMEDGDFTRFANREAEREMLAAIKAWVACEPSKRPSAEALGRRIANIAATLGVR